MSGIVTNWLMAFLHHLAAFTLFSTVVYELILLRKPFDVQTAQSLLKTDQIYGISAVTILIIGFGRAMHFEKGEAYYFHSLPFIVKISLFALVGILSIYPTIKFLSWRSVLKQQQLPQVSETTLNIIRCLIHIELAAV
ncbi:MAG: putative rane protein, partial [Cellvibrio sp.]|nr:putative rane protein [Cellvibrio sp.]